MSKLLVFIFVLFLAVLALFAIHNQKSTTVTVPFGNVYETPTIALILLSIAIGALAMLFIFVVRDTKRYVNNLQLQKKQKRGAKIQELYAKALNHLFAHHNLPEAKALFTEVLAEDPEHFNALLQLGDIALSEDDFQTARENYQRAWDLNPKNIEVLFSLERLMEKTARWPNALRYIEEILEIDDKNLSALYKKRDILEKLEKWDDLVFVQKTILKNEHTEKDKNRERQNLVGYKYEYGRYSLENGDLEKAKKAFRTVLRLEKDFVPLLISVGEPLRLIRIYKNNILKNPQDPVVKFFLGRLHYRLEMIDDAFEIMTSIDTGGVVYPEMHQLLGNLYIKRNQIEKAAQEYKKALESNACAFSLSYRCSHCKHTAAEWSGRCAQCQQWSTYQLNLSV
ncbi:MAG: tetratricopeptide repeat protein [Nitrospirae bacterium]|nr:tetratricopeptide repeat protein [Nitrospirota bacterium]